MAAAYESDSEEDLPSLDELLRRRIPTKPPAIVLQQQETVAVVTVTPSGATTAESTTKITLQSPSNSHSTPAQRRSPRLPSPAALPPQQTTPIKYSQLDEPTSSARRRSLADELFPPSPPSAPPPPQPAFTVRTDLYSYREPSPSIISDSEPDLPSPVKPRRREPGGESARRLDRRESRENFWVEDSEDERVAQVLQEEERRHSAQVEPGKAAAGPRSRGRASVAVYDLDSEDETSCTALPATQDEDFGIEGLLIHNPPSVSRTPNNRSQRPVATDTPRAARPASTKTPATLRRRITISILESDSDSSSESDHVVSKPRQAQPSTREEKTEAVEVVVDDEDDGEPQNKRTKPQLNELVVTLPSERSMGGTPIRRRSETPEQQFFGEDDTNDGVLVYEPTPRSRKPVKLPSSTGKNPTSSPSRTPGKARKPAGPSKRSVSIDLTESSDSDSEEEVPKLSTTRPPTILFPPPRGPPKPRLTPAAAPSPISTPKRSVKPTPSTPSRKSAASTLLTDAQRESLPLKLIVELDRAVFRRSWSGGKCIDGPGEATGVGLPSGIEIKWNKKLRNTAGRASWKRVKTGGTTTHITSIDLATKVTDTEEKLRQTLAHELCHIAAWVLSGELKPPHGDAFKLWAKRIMSVRSDIIITTTHSYEISYKFRWQCQNSSCAKIFSRHSRSIDPSTQGCPCGSRLTEIDADGKPKIVRRTPAKKSGWQEFLAVTSPAVRLENPGIRNDEVFKVVAERYRATKSAAEAREGAAEGRQRGLEEGLSTLEV